MHLSFVIPEGDLLLQLLWLVILTLTLSKVEGERIPVNDDQVSSGLIEEVPKADLYQPVRHPWLLPA